MNKQIIEEVVIKKQWCPDVNDGRELQEVLVECVRGFWLKTCDGPLTKIERGEQVVLTDRALLQELFCAGKILPIRPGIPASASYVLCRAMRVVIDGVFKDLKFGDLVELTREEVVTMLRQRFVLPVDERNFKI